MRRDINQLCSLAICGSAENLAKQILSAKKDSKLVITLKDYKVQFVQNNMKLTIFIYIYTSAAYQLANIIYEIQGL